MSGKKQKPDFIYIGMPRTGSSWFFQRLFRHPDVWLAPRKEIDYFWGYPLVVKGQKAYGRHSHRRYIRNRLKYFAKRRNMLKWKLMLWDLRYYFLPRSPKWYSSLFPDDKIGGDISPTLAILRDSEIEKLTNWLPEVKIIIGLRDPAERAWSEISHEMDQVKNLHLGNARLEDVKEELDRIYNYCPDYIELIERWRKFIGGDRIFIAFYDSLKQNPREHFNRLCNFIGVDPDRVEEPSPKAANQSPRAPMPVEIEAYLRNKYAPHVERLYENADFEVPEGWRSKYLKYAE